jgi:hypothetical protein
MAKAIVAISRQIDGLRKEESSEASWFILPYEGDDDVDWMNFQVQIQGPVRRAWCWVMQRNPDG